MIHLAQKRLPHLRYTAALIWLIPLLFWSHHAHADARPPQSVTAVWSTKNHLDAFVIDTNGVVVSSWWESGKGWQPWFAISPESATAAAGQPVTAVWSNSQHLDLFITGYDGRVMSTFWESAKGWQPWFAISPESATAAAGQPQPVTAVWSSPQHLDLFITVSTAATKCAKWRRESVPVWLREKGREALASCVAARIEARGV